MNPPRVAAPIGIGADVPPPPRITVGRIVHYVLPENGAIRPAIVVRVFFDSSLANLRVMIDAEEDTDEFGIPFASWRSAVHYGAHAQHATWHWPPRT